MKKAELSMTVIVSAAVALLILVTLSFLVLKGTSPLSEAATCTSLNEQAECIPDNELCSDLGNNYGPSTGSCSEGYKCCNQVGD